MKKTVKKLKLAKETVRTLAEPEIAELVLGGTFSTGCPSRIQHCFNTQQTSCTC
jgi:hypothetical protein